MTRKAEILSKIAELQNALKIEEERDISRLGLLCVKAGLANVEVSPDDLMKELQMLAARFPQISSETIIAEKKRRGRPKGARNVLGTEVKAETSEG